MDQNKFLKTIYGIFSLISIYLILNSLKNMKNLEMVEVNIDHLEYQTRRGKPPDEEEKQGKANFLSKDIKRLTLNCTKKCTRSNKAIRMETIPYRYRPSLPKLRKSFSDHKRLGGNRKSGEYLADLKIFKNYRTMNKSLENFLLEEARIYVEEFWGDFEKISLSRKFVGPVEKIDGFMKYEQLLNVICWGWKKKKGKIKEILREILMEILNQ